MKQMNKSPDESGLEEYLRNINFKPETKKNFDSEGKIVLRLTGVESWNDFLKWITNNFDNNLEKHFKIENVLSEKATIVEYAGELGCDENKFVDAIVKILKKNKLPIPYEKRKGCDFIEPKEAKKFPRAFDIIDATPLLYSLDWRLGLARLLRLLKPGGYLIFPGFEEDSLLIDGEVAKWISNLKMINNLHDTFIWLFYKIEGECNRPWIPEIALSKPYALCQFAKHVLDYDTKDNEYFLLKKESLKINFTGKWAAKNFLDFYPFKTLISDIEKEKLEKALKIHLKDLAPAEETSLDFRVSWVAIKFPKEALNVNKIHDAAVLSMNSGERYLIDSEHHLLPEMNRELEKNVEFEDQRILRTIRGFVTRMIQHDRFDPDNYQLFAATLWNPKKNKENPDTLYNISEGDFRGITGYVFRSGDKEEEKFDQVLRNITYLAHALHNKATLQTIPQTLFNTDRPIIRVVMGKKPDWDYEIRGYSQADYSFSEGNEIELEKIYDSVQVPSEITFYVPAFDETGDIWNGFRTEIINPILKKFPNAVKQIEKEIWQTNVSNLYSFPWNYDKGKDISWDFLPKKMDSESRGLAAGIITNQIYLEFMDTFKGHRLNNLWVSYLFREKEKVAFDLIYSPHENSFRNMIERLLKELNYSEKLDRDTIYRWAYVFISLGMVFPKIEKNKPWELRQIPIGAFVIDETEKKNQEKRFVSAGSALLISKLKSEELTITKDVALRQDLAEMRATQLLKRVPGVLLPITLMIYKRIFDEETARYATRAAISQVMARNMSHNLGSHVLSRLVTKDAMEKYLNYQPGKL